MSWFRQLDDTLFDHVFQPMVNWLGKPPADIARFLITGCLVCFAAMPALLFTNAALDARNAVQSGLLLASALTLYRFTCMMGTRASTRQSAIRMLPLGVFFRLFNVTLLAIDTGRTLRTMSDARFDLANFQSQYVVIGLFANLLLILWLYIVACASPPPKERRAPRYAATT